MSSYSLPRISCNAPVYEAAYYGHTEIVKALLEAGANVNQADNYGGTPFSLFIQKEWKNIIKLALIHNEDLLSQCRDIESDYGKESVVQKAVEEIYNEAKKEYDNSASKEIDKANNDYLHKGLNNLILSKISREDAYDSLKSSNPSSRPSK